MIRTVKHDEIHCNSRIIIIDTAEMQNGVYETMALFKATGEDICTVISATEPDALKAHDEILSNYKVQELPAKYAKLRDDIKAALAIGRAAEDADPEDGGTCNFDSPALFLPRWNSRLVMQAVRDAGSGAFDWKAYGGRRYVIRPDSRCQANARSRNAEAMTKALSALGYDCMMYYQMD